MKAPEFEATVDDQIARSRDMLFSKNAHYNPTADKLRGFKATAALRGTTPQGALAGMMAKHTLSVYDMCESGQEYPIDVWNEKISDHINYLLLLRAVIEEQEQNKVIAGDTDSLYSSDQALGILRERLRGNPNVIVHDDPVALPVNDYTTV
jgi:hypothetical protein